MGLSNNLGKLSNMITSNGSSVGIGTSTLTSGIPLSVNVATSNNCNIAFQENASDKWYIRNITSSNAFSFYSVAGSTEVMRLTSDNKVGINESSPLGTFHARGTASADTLYRLEPTSNVYAAKLLMSSRSSGDGGIRYGSGGGNNLDIFSYDTMRFYCGTANLSGAVGDERMRITSGGNVNINTTGALQGAAQAQVNIRQLSNTTGLAIAVENSGATHDGTIIVGCQRSASSAYSLITAYSGNGSTDDFSDREFQLRGDGNGYCDGSWTGGGADYAEYFEWEDGNLNNEDRRGYCVTLVENKIKIANNNDIIIGVVSSNPSIVGDSAYLKWSGQYLKDEFGSYILDNDGHRVLNPEYDESKEYIPREKRKEWSIVGLMGKLRIRKGQATMPNWIKMRDISENIEEWLIK